MAVLIAAVSAKAQEMVVPLGYNPHKQGDITTKSEKGGAVMKVTSPTLTLPFFEDFAANRSTPDTNKWAESQVYINNTMCFLPVSRGVASFDALNQWGMPYEPNINIAVRYADSLTSRMFDLSLDSPDDSIYMSFFYQPQGNGFAPEAQDSLALYFYNKDSVWVKVWSKEGSNLHAFRQVMVPLNDPQFLHVAFHFRFVNKASININDDVWNLDYIRIAKNRTINDTVVNDLAYINNPTFLLNDYSYMPYHQFLANQNGERAGQIESIFINNYQSGQNVNYGFFARETESNTILSSGVSANANVPAGQQQHIVFPSYSTAASFIEKYKFMNFVDTFYLQSPPNEPHENDTIVRQQFFHNYFAYDDWSAEKSYFLSLFTTLPGKIAVEFETNEPDTLSGIAIYFGRQVPSGANKYFSVAVYESISPGSNGEKILYQEDFFYPGYLNQNLYTYKFAQKVPVPKGKFYIGTIQPALAGSDSLYIGLDVNRAGDNHLYYNLLAKWEKSNIQGALMIRPIVGPIIPSSVTEIIRKDLECELFPNPASNSVRLRFEGDIAEYHVFDVHGRMVLQGAVVSEAGVDISSLNSGVYFMRVNIEGLTGTTKKLIKL